jgi:hypothetical protein
MPGNEPAECYDKHWGKKKMLSCLRGSPKPGSFCCHSMPSQPCRTAEPEKDKHVMLNFPSLMCGPPTIKWFFTHWLLQYRCVCNHAHTHTPQSYAKLQNHLQRRSLYKMHIHMCEQYAICVCVCVVLGLELRPSTLRHSTSPFL